MKQKLKDNLTKSKLLNEKRIKILDFIIEIEEFISNANNLVYTEESMKIDEKKEINL